MAALQEPFMLDGLAIQTHTSIGIAVSPDHGADVPTLMQRADVAMYEAKRSGSGYAVYTVEHDKHSVRRLTLSSELRRALDQDELLLHYQPKLAIPTGDVIGVECLIRWQHPEHGMLGPEEFIGLAEVSGLIRPLTRWVIHEAARQCRAWADKGFHLGMAVNISVRNLYDAGLVEYIRHVLDVHDLTADRLLLEITENEVMEDPVLAMEVLGRIGALGVALSIDDFGTGYSSLSYLKQLPIDEIKIDQSFVAGLDTSEHDQVIVRSIIDLGHNLGRIVTAEGVEDVATWNRLIELGCDRAQGYLLGRPMTPDKIVEWMTASHPTSSFRTTAAGNGDSPTTAVGRSS
jgi:EAL domain-containing protein (putative c-di-GMP-specific phosphodiesterase class I)